MVLDPSFASRFQTKFEQHTREKVQQSQSEKQRTVWQRLTRRLRTSRDNFELQDEFLSYNTGVKSYVIEESPASHFLTADTRSALLWLFVRVYLGWMWLEAGWGKFNNSAWIGDNAGSAMSGFVDNALTKTGGAHPDVQWWYAWFLQNVVQPYPEAWAYAITYGEMLVGVALILGLFAGVAAFLGVFMNLNFMLAGALSVNPVMAVLAIGLILAWRVAGYWGLDRYVLPRLHRTVRPHIRAR